MMKRGNSKSKIKVSYIFHTLGYFYKMAFRLQPSYFIYVGLLIIANTVFPLINVVLPKYLMDELLSSRDVKKLVLLAATIILSSSIYEIIKKFCAENQNKIADGYYRYLEMMINNKAMEMDFEATEDPNVLDKCSKAENGLRKSDGIQGFTNNFITIVSSVLLLIGVIGLVITNSPFLIIILVVNIIISTFLNRKMNQVEIEFFHKNVDTNRAYDYVCNELPNFRLGKDIRLYDAENMMLNKEYELGDILVKKEEEHSSRLLKYSQKSVLTNALRESLTFLYLGYQAVKGYIGIGDFTMLLQSCITFSNSLTGIIDNGMQINVNLNFMKEYIDFIDMGNIMEQGNQIPEKAEGYKIEFRNVTFRYPNTDKDILKDINIVIRPGEHLSIVGENGAGKTTFIKLLCRLYDVSEGEILLNGINIRDFYLEEYHRLLSVVFQDFRLLSFTLRENIMLGNSRKDSDTDRKLQQLCDTCGLGEKIISLPKGLDTGIYKEFDGEGIEPSGGEAQKLSIARALYKDAPISILDEPTAALDPVAEYEVYSHFNKLIGGKTAVYISHRLSSCRFCDKIAVFSGGTIAEYGSHDDLVLIDHGVYRNMYRTQAQYYQ